MEDKKEEIGTDLKAEFSKSKEAGKDISEESAKNTFNKILDYYDIDFEDIVNDQGKEGAKTLQNKFIRAIRKGRVETNVDDDPKKGFQIIQHLSTGKTITYNEYNATAAEESDKGKGSSAMQYHLLASLSGKGVPYIKNATNFRGPDVKLAEYIAILFLL